MLNLLFRVRVWLKLLMRRFFLVKSFCKLCGVDVRDYHAPDDVWRQIEPHVKHGNVLCYNCFVDLCEVVGAEAAWHLYHPERPIISNVGKGKLIDRAEKKHEYIWGDDDGMDPKDIFVPFDALKIAVDLIEDGVSGSYHGNVNGVPEHEWRIFYYAAEDASKQQGTF